AQPPAAATLHADPYEHPPPGCPPEFIDSITHCLMRDPVSGLPLDSSQVKPDLVLQQRIRSWLASHPPTSHQHQH
ncbi:hypothetical protein H4R19_003397, partial [Coemansia spiralis]